MPNPARTVRQVAKEDEFYAGIWWVWDVPGLGLRAATLGECAAEIQRLRGLLAACGCLGKDAVTSDG